MSETIRGGLSGLPVQPRGLLHVVVLAGGHGRRLLEMTARYGGPARPKQFCRFGGKRTLLEETLVRFSSLAPAKRTVVVVDRKHRKMARESLEAWPGATWVCQPQDRGTGPGILLPLATVLTRDPHAVVVVSPSDHGIEDQETFRRSVGQAQLAVMHDPSRIVMFGVEATAPRTDYGWITPGDEIHDPLPLGLREVVGFVEKPSPREALYLARTGALWSTMVLVARATAIMDLFRRALPGVAERFLTGGETAPQAGRSLERLYETLGFSDFSRDILSKAGGLAVLEWPAMVGWSDLGTPERMAAWLERGGVGGTATAESRGATLGPDGKVRGERAISCL